MKIFTGEKFLQKALSHSGKITRRALTTLMLLAATMSYAQKAVTITGIVTDASTKQPVIGATVMLKGSTVGVATNTAGVYSINVPSAKGGGTLVFSYLGYTSQDVPWHENKTTINVALASDMINMEEVVVVGYGTQNKSTISGAISSVGKERLENTPSASASSLLQGAVAGLNFTTNAASSNPDGDNIILVRGRNSISAESKPLIILDGAPFEGSLGEIATNDIASMEVLKDASAVAIYGSRAASGVILIGTKQGEKGKVRVSYDGSYSIQTVSNFPNVMDIDQYRDFQMMKKDVDTDFDEDDPSTWGITQFEQQTYRMMKNGQYPNYNWRDVILRTGSSMSHKFSVSGGGDKTRFNVSAGMLDTKGIVKGDDYERYNLRANLTTDITKWLEFSTNNSGTFADNSGSKPKFEDAFNKSPLYRPWNEDGSININPAGPEDTKKGNPLETQFEDDLNRTYSAMTTNNFKVKFGFLPGLSYNLRLSAQFSTTEKNHYIPTDIVAGRADQGKATVENRIKYATTIDNILEYKHTFNKKHDVFLTGLYSWEDKVDKTNLLTSTGFSNNFMSWYGATSAAKQTPSFKYSKIDILSLMLRANYAYDGRYIATYTVRRDGASVFGANTKNGTFQSGSLAWNVSNEKFFAPWSHVMNMLKLRVSYGENGNMGIKPYETIPNMDNSSYLQGSNGSSDYINGGNVAPGFMPSTLGTPDLSWETTRAFNIGLDFAFLNNRISGDFNYYDNKTHGLLLKREISPINGISSVVQNVGKIGNKGVEFTINSVNIQRKDFTWQTNATFAWNRNAILDIGDNYDIYGYDLAGDLGNKWFIGHPINVNFDYLITGTWQLREAYLAGLYGALPGYAKYDDRDNDGKYSEYDRQVIGTPDPSYTMSLTNTFRYKDFSLSVLLYGVVGAMKSNAYYNSNNTYIVRDWWTETNPTNEYWAAKYASTGNKYFTGGASSSSPDKFQCADYLRVKDITFSYNLPRKFLNRLGVSSTTVYFSAKNPWTATKFGGMDPELGTDRNIPLNKEFMFGLKLAF